MTPTTPAPAPAPGPDAVPVGEMLRLDRQICFSLHAASRAFNSIYRVLLKDLGLTYPQYLVMLVLWEQGELPVKSLGEELRLDSGTLSPLLKRLETAGLLTRERSAKDERSVDIRLTGAGSALRERALLVPHRIAEATNFDLGELRELRGSLNRLISALDEADLRDADLDDAGHAHAGLDCSGTNPGGAPAPSAPVRE